MSNERSLITPLIILIFCCFVISIGKTSVAKADDLNRQEISCTKKTISNPEFVRAMKAIAKLPEFSRMAKSISEIDGRNKIQFDEKAQSYKAENKKCYWEITAYINREDENRRPQWQSFLVSVTGKIAFVNDLEGNYISLRQWRSSNNLTRFITELNCYKTKIKVITFCNNLTIDGLRRQCPRQEFILTIKERPFFVRNVFFNNFSSDPSRSQLLECKAGGHASFIAVRFSNLGNGASCFDCEWADFYSASKGRYLGSTKSMYQGKMRGRFYIQNQLSKKIEVTPTVNSKFIKDE